jgi:hypothetical protein
MSKKRTFPLIFSAISLCLLLLLAACGSAPTGQGGQTPTSGTTPGVTATEGGGNPPVATPTTAPTTSPVPPTQTSCPAANTARAAVFATLALGSHPNIVYIVNEFSGTTSTFGTLKRVDTSTGQKTEIVKLASTYINSAQVSSDGQWILFVALVNGQARLQLVRMDGKGLQTLYCATPTNGAYAGSAIDAPQWTSNLKLVAFNDARNIKLLNMQSGSLTTEFIGPQVSAAFLPVTWLDATRLYVRELQADEASFTIFLLDTSKGPGQTMSSLTPIYDASSGCQCGDFDSSYDGQHLYISSYVTAPGSIGPGYGIVKGPGTISMRPATGGASSLVFTSQEMAFTTLRDINSNTLLLLVENRGAGVDTSKNGLWELRTDGTGLKQLASQSGAANGADNLNVYNQYPWSNVSRDGSLYALQYSQGKQTVLSYASLSGGPPTVFANIADGTQLSIVGWTTA